MKTYLLLILFLLLTIPLLAQKKYNESDLVGIWTSGYSKEVTGGKEDFHEYLITGESFHIVGNEVIENNKYFITRASDNKFMITELYGYDKSYSYIFVYTIEFNNINECFYQILLTCNDVSGIDIEYNSKKLTRNRVK